MMEQKMKAMISQPLGGKTDEEITRTRENAIQTLQAMGYEVINTLYTSEWYSPEKLVERGVKHVPLCFLAKGLEQMCTVDAVYFCEGWENARGCRIEHEAAKAYGVKRLYAEA